MRKLLAKDLFKISRIIKKINLKEELKGIDIANKSNQQVGMDIILLIIENAGQAEKEVFDFIEDISEVKGVANLELSEFLEIVSNIIRENENITDFFTQAFKSI